MDGPYFPWVNAAETASEGLVTLSGAVNATEGSRSISNVKSTINIQVAQSLPTQWLLSNVHNLAVPNTPS